eukprot:Rmarinus@m.16730
MVTGCHVERALYIHLQWNGERVRRRYLPCHTRRGTMHGPRFSDRIRLVWWHHPIGPDRLLRCYSKLSCLLWGPRAPFYLSSSFSTMGRVYASIYCLPFHIATSTTTCTPCSAGYTSSGGRGTSCSRCNFDVDPDRATWTDQTCEYTCRENYHGVNCDTCEEMYPSIDTTYATFLQENCSIICDDGYAFNRTIDSLQSAEVIAEMGVQCERLESIHCFENEEIGEDGFCVPCGPGTWSPGGESATCVECDINPQPVEINRAVWDVCEYECLDEYFEDECLTCYEWKGESPSIENSHWTDDCEFQCDVGYYYHNQRCNSLTGDDDDDDDVYPFPTTASPTSGDDNYPPTNDDRLETEDNGITQDNVVSFVGVLTIGITAFAAMLMICALFSLFVQRRRLRAAELVGIPEIPAPISIRDIQSVGTVERYVPPADGEDPDSTCCICLEDYEEGDELRKMFCGHRFHKPCIETWGTVKSECPLCKRDLRQAVPAHEQHHTQPSARSPPSGGGGGVSQR